MRDYSKEKLRISYKKTRENTLPRIETCIKEEVYKLAKNLFNNGQLNG